MFACSLSPIEYILVYNLLSLLVYVSPPMILTSYILLSAYYVIAVIACFYSRYWQQTTNGKPETAGSSCSIFNRLGKKRSVTLLLG